MKVLVTGAAGVIGSAVALDLQANGHEVIAVGSSDADLTDLAETIALLDRVRPEAVVHMAARVHGLMGNLHSQGAIFYDNVRINTNLIEAARLAGVRKIVAMGSVAMYPAGVALPMVESDVWSGPPHSSEFGYASAKRAMLAQLESYRDQYGLDYAFALSTNLLGPNDRFDEINGHVLPSLISKFYRGATEGGSVVVWGSGTATRDFLHSSDAASALRTMLEKGSGTFNLASGKPVSIAQVVQSLETISGFHGGVEWDRTKPDGQVQRSYDISRIEALGWEPKLSFDVALRNTYEWYAENNQSARR
jgi:GDP-L-fucose synthase